MAIAAHIEDSTQPDGARRGRRRTLRLEARGAVGAGGATDVLVHNISATGLLIESRAALAVGEKIAIDLPQAGATDARIIWESGNLFGCQFDRPISAAALSAALLRSPGQPETPIAPPRDAFAQETFGLRLQRLRKARGLTLAQIATQLGVSKPTVWAWENGRAHPVEGRIEALAKTLGVLVSEIQPGSKDTAELRELLARSRAQIAAAFGTSSDKVRIMVEL